MAYTQADLDFLENVIAQGAQSIQYQDRKLVCRSLGEMLRLREFIRRQLGLCPVTHRGTVTSKGLDDGPRTWPWPNPWP
jgi:hypothetical protein